MAGRTRGAVSVLLANSNEGWPMRRQSENEHRYSKAEA